MLRAYSTRLRRLGAAAATTIAAVGLTLAGAQPAAAADDVPASIFTISAAQGYADAGAANAFPFGAILVLTNQSPGSNRWVSNSSFVGFDGKRYHSIRHYQTGLCITASAPGSEQFLYGATCSPTNIAQFWSVEVRTDACAPSPCVPIPYALMRQYLEPNKAVKPLSGLLTLRPQYGSWVPVAERIRVFQQPAPPR